MLRVFYTGLSLLVSSKHKSGISAQERGKKTLGRGPAHKDEGNELRHVFGKNVHPIVLNQ